MLYNRMVYEKLQIALNEEEQLVYRQRVEELAPSLRYCAYNIGDQTAMDDLLSLRSQAHGDLLENLDVRDSYSSTECSTRYHIRG